MKGIDTLCNKNRQIFPEKYNHIKRFHSEEAFKFYGYDLINNNQMCATCKYKIWNAMPIKEKLSLKM